MLSTIQVLKNVKKLPKNGLAIFCGLVSKQDDSKTEQKDVSTGKVKLKKIKIVVEPLQPIKQGMYKCDNRFHVEELLEQLKRTDKTYGYIIMTGDGTVMATLSGSKVEIVHTIKDPNLPNKQRKGGQSSVRFSRLRVEARARYVKKVAETANKVFIQKDLPNVNGLIIAGVAGFKKELVESEAFDSRLKKIVKQVIDTAYGGEAGLKQAIQMSTETLDGLQFAHEKEIIQKFMADIAKDAGTVVYGYNQTLYALENSAVDTLLIWENLPIKRYNLRNPETKEEHVIYLAPGNQTDNYFKKHDKFEIIEEKLLIDYLIENCKKFGAKIELITDHTSEGKMFCNSQGFGGIGGLLRFSFDIPHLEEQDDKDETTDLDEFY